MRWMGSAGWNRGGRGVERWIECCGMEWQCGVECYAMGGGGGGVVG